MRLSMPVCVLLGLVLSLSSLAAPPWASADILSNLTLWWRLDETTGTSATDSSGASRTGTLDVTGDWRSGATCKVINCLAFSSAAPSQFVGSGVALGTLGTASTFTVGLWFKATGTPLDQLFAYDLAPLVVDANFYLGIFWGRLNGGAEQLHVYNWDGDEDTVSTNYTPGTWVHVGLVHGAGTLSLYLDGALISSTASGNTEVTTGTLQVSHNVLNAQCTTLCLVDEVRMYARALTAGDMAELAAFGVTTPAVTAPLRRMFVVE